DIYTLSLHDALPIYLRIDSLQCRAQVARMVPTRDTLPGAWARLKQDVNCGLRRGAWYRVVGLTPEDAVLQVPRRERVRVPRRFRSEEHTSELQSRFD